MTPSDSPVISATTEQLDAAIASGAPLVVDFWAPWCRPCTAMAPVLERFAADRAGTIQVVKVNVDDEPGAATQHTIRSVPTVLVFHHGQLVGRRIGAVNDRDLIAFVDQSLTDDAR